MVLDSRESVRAKEKTEDESNERKFMEKVPEEIGRKCCKIMSRGIELKGGSGGLLCLGMIEGEENWKKF